VPVPDLGARLIPVINLLSNASWQTGNYCRWTPDPRKDEVRLLCRNSDVAVWQRTLRDSST